VSGGKTVIVTVVRALLVYQGLADSRHTSGSDNTIGGLFYPIAVFTRIWKYQGRSNQANYTDITDVFPGALAIRVGGRDDSGNQEKAKQ
jgi:hypothetical protein